MSKSPVTEQPQFNDSIFTLMPDEYIRFEYKYKPGCCHFSTITTTVTNMRLIRRVIKAPGIFSYRTSPSEEKTRMVFLTDDNKLKQIKSAISSSETKWWMKLLNIFTCNYSNEPLDWLQLWYATDNLAINNINESSVKTNDDGMNILIEKF